jgi:hypothetical protein
MTKRRTNRNKLPSQTCVGRCASRNNSRCRLRTARDHKCWIHSQSEDGLRVMRSRVAGLGLYTARPFQKGEELCRYTGKLKYLFYFILINLHLCVHTGKMRTKAWVDSKPARELQYIMRVGRDGRTGETWHIDATQPTSCYARFINSIYHTGRPENAHFVNAQRSTQNYIKVVAARKINPGTELLTNYGGPGGFFADT